MVRTIVGEWTQNDKHLDVDVRVNVSSKIRLWIAHASFYKSPDEHSLEQGSPFALVERL